MALALLATACNDQPAAPAPANPGAPPVVNSSASAKPTSSTEDACGVEPKQLRWRGLVVAWRCGELGRRVVRVSRDGLLFDVEAEHLDRLELVELDGSEPQELWIATSAGAHGNRQDVFYGLNAGQPRQLLSVATDEGDLEVRDLDGDGRSEITGTITGWFDATAEDFERPLVLSRRGKRWKDVTSAFPERYRAAILTWKQAAAASSSCDATHALNIYGLSVLSGAPGEAERYVHQHCPYAVEWFTRNRQRMQAHAQRAGFSQGNAD